MPYIKEQSVILTKVIGVASKLNDGDEIKVRQVVLQRMADSPEDVSMIYLRGRQVWVSFNDGREFYLGDIRAKYEQIILDNPTKIKSWQITGGHDIAPKTIKLAGHETITKSSIRAQRGLNIHIDIL